MAFTALDWLSVFVYVAVTIGITLYVRKRASTDTTEFFLSGRNLKWWVVGTSMVATTFAADTPLAVTELVAQNGIAGNWLWWNMLFGAMLTVFFFARLWRRSGVLTDVEFVELRYSGAEAAWLRGIKAVFFGLFMNGVILAWVTLAMETVIAVLFPGITLFGQTSFHLLGLHISAPLAIVGLIIIFVALYSLTSGLLGVALTDVFQFGIAMTGTIVLAVYALDIPEVGGISGLLEKLPASTFQFLPTIGETAAGAGVLALSGAAFFAYIGVQWWSSWYPGAEPGGGGYVAQRMMSAKDEKNSLFAALWFTIAHYCIRPWPWIIVALVSLVLYPGLENPREGFVMVMRDVLPSGLLGLLFTAFLAAFTSTFAAQLNWGTSYLINDLWARFVKPGAEQAHYIKVSRIVTALLAVVAFLITTQLSSIAQAWGLVISASAGLGLVLILRWYWWRVNAWSELAATLTPIALVLLAVLGVIPTELFQKFPENLFYVVGITTPVWLIVTFLTKPTDAAKLDAFYARVRPGGPGWKAVGARNPDVKPDSGLLPLFFDWVAGVILVYMSLFGIGNLLFGKYGYAALCLGLAAGAAYFIYWDLNRRGFDNVMES
jgi:SSS family solute:Na+ symporter